MTRSYHPMRVAIDGEPSFRADALCDINGLPVRWNGWIACPMFDRAEAGKVADWSNEIAGDAIEAPRFHWEGDILVETVWNGEPIVGDRPAVYDQERHLPDATGRYAIGAWSWVWQEIEEDGEIPLVAN